MGNSVLVIAECGAGFGPATRELLTLGRALADSRGGDLAVLPIGGDAARLAADAGTFGADRIYRMPASGEGYDPDASTAASLAAIRAGEAGIILLTHAPFGVDLAPRVAFRAEARWVSGCVAVAVEGEAIHCTRTEVGGKVIAQRTVAAPLVVTLRPKSVDVVERGGGAADIVDLACEPPAPGAIRCLGRQVAAGGAAAELEAAEIVVSGGLGLGAADAFEAIRQLAGQCGGVVGASKQAVDRGWIEPDRQVGLTGTTVAPRLYVAVGISGAPQHMAGCQKSRAIVAINKDAEAPIFQYARYGIVGDWKDVLPAMIEALGAA